MEVTGKITKILDKVTGEKKDGSGTWEKQTFVLQTQEQYNDLYAFEVFGAEKVGNLNQYNKVGDTVKVDFNVSTNEYNGKYYTSLQAWKIFKANLEETPVEAASADLPF
jgi:hypothetical protein